MAGPFAIRRVAAGLGALALISLAQPTASVTAADTWRVGGPQGGTVRAVAVKPGSSSVLLAGTGGAGIFRSQDGGASWAPSRAGLPADTTVNAIAFAPSAPHIVFAATHGFGLVRSTDSGRTWTQAWSDSTVLDVAVDPLDEDRVVLVAAVGVHLSTDGGDTWDELRQGLDPIAADRAAFAPSESNVLYVGGVAGVIRTDDSGDSWSSDPSGPTNITALAVDPDDAQRLFAATHFDGVFRSVNGGTSWTPARAGLPVVPLAPDVRLPVLSLLLDPADPNVLYAGSERGGYLYRSTDGGESWIARPLGLSPHTARALAADPADGQPLFAGLNFDGLLRTSDGGASWARSDAGLIGSGILSLLTNPGRPSHVVAGTHGGGVWLSTDRGVTWSRAGLRGQVVHGLSSSPERPDTLYAAASGGLHRSTNAGASWRRVQTFDPRHVLDVAVAPSAPSTVYAMTYDGLWRSRDAGASWKRVSWRSTLSAVAVHPRRPQTVYLGLVGRILTSSDGGASWTSATGPPPYGSPRDFAIDPVRPWIVYAAIDADGFWRSRDRGATWQRMAQATGLTWAHDIALDGDGDVFIGGFDVTFGGGVYRSPDRGATWHSLGTAGLSTTWVASVALAPDGSRLYAGSTAYALESGGGVFARGL